MAIKELDAGQTHSFSPTAVRVQLTGTAFGVKLMALDQAGDESETVRLTDTEVVLTPQPRRLRLVVVPATGHSFVSGASLGLTLRTEGASAAAEQILVSSVDVGALTSHVLAVLEFATNRAILTVAGAGGGIAPAVSVVAQPFISGSPFAASQPTTLVQTVPDDHEHRWLRAGRYALRDAEKLGAIGIPVETWGVVLDGSASMRALYHSGQLDVLLGLVCGIYVQWTSRWATVSTVAGIQVADIESASTVPQRLSSAAFENIEPSSWSTITNATAHVLRRVGPGGAVVIMTDGVPGDIDRLAACCRTNPNTRFTIVTTGISRLGLPSEATPHWWEEELAGLVAVDDLPNTTAVAVRLSVDGQFDLAGSRSAELALCLTSPLTVGAPA